MRISRFYLPENYISGSRLTLSKDQAHYALTVLRLKNGHQIEVFDGKGNFASAKIEHTGRRSAEVLLENVQQADNESPLQTILLQGISKGDRMDYTLQKAVELGVTQIQPLFTERVDVKLNGDKLEKRRSQWQYIVNSACEQSGRAFVPPVLPIMTLEAYLAQGVTEQGILCDPYADKRLGDLPHPKLDRPVKILIGPEGGLSKTEVEQAQKNGFRPVQLGPRILRTETTGPVILALLQSLWGDI